MRSNLSVSSATRKFRLHAEAMVTTGHRCFRIAGHSESAGVNRHVVGDARALQERKQRLHPGLESCAVHREVCSEA
jgi:hypothetical protein